jgi:hypothetical protein
MPEVVTKYPEVLIQELKDAGGKCGQGLQAQILTRCPKDQFCVLPTGEICVYDLNEITEMTQVTPSEWSEAIRHVPAMYDHVNLIFLVMVLALGLIIGMIVTRRKS